MSATSLLDYAEQQFPGRPADLWRGHDPSLAQNTVVMHVMGQTATESAISVLEHRVGEAHVAAVLIHAGDDATAPATSSTSAVTEVVRERLPAIGMAAAVGVALAIIVAIMARPNAFVVLLLAIAGGLVGAALGFVIEGNRLDSHLHTTVGAEVGVVAALIDDESFATELANTLEHEGLYDVRIVHPDELGDQPG